MNKKHPMPLTFKGHLVFFLLAVVLIGACYKLIPFARMVSNEDAGNPNKCHYYITLQSILAGYPLLSYDKANTLLIKHKIAKFERNVNSVSANSKNALDYKNKYYNILTHYNVTSINSIVDEAILIEIAKKVSPIIDNYYLDENIYCVNPLYTWHSNQRRILRYNTNGLYDHLPSKYSTVLIATPDDWLTGSSPEFFLVNETTTLDTRFMTSIPLLTAIYTLPKYNFVKVGSYASPAHWSYFRTQSFTDPITRKVLDIAGIDVFTVSKAELGNRKIPDTTPLATDIHPLFNSWQSFVNHNSYGLAYIANTITYTSENDVVKKENMIKHYFSHHDNPEHFTQITNTFYNQLMKLKQKHDIILESNAPVEKIVNKKNNTVTIKGIVGERAFFTTHCLDKTCTFVFNISKAHGWHAFVNGINTAITRANFAFMAIQVPHGVSTVWFIFSPLFDELTYFISIFFLLGLMIISIRRINKI